MRNEFENHRRIHDMDYGKFFLSFRAGNENIPAEAVLERYVFGSNTFQKPGA